MSKSQLPIPRPSSRASLAEEIEEKIEHELPFVGSIDQGTSSTRFMVFDRQGRVVAFHQIPFQTITPHAGWADHDPVVIMKTVTDCVEKTCEILTEMGYNPASDIKAIGITNQRETTVVWDKVYGLPLHPAIVWLDTRTADTVNQLIEKAPGKDRDALREKCGLPLSTYFSAVKLKWLFDNVAPVKQASDSKRLAVGTIDSWLIWNLTGREAHVTDVTNASRTMLMNLKTLEWDPSLLDFFGVPADCLPKIVPSSQVYGKMAEGPLKGVPISGDLGDQQAALVGQRCFAAGLAKSTYGTGCFLLYNTGDKPVVSKNGLLTTVGYQLGPGKETAMYALEGSIAAAGAAVNWLRDNMKMYSKVSEVDELVNSVPNTGGVYFVPAFSGLFAPYWKEDARGTIVGLTTFSTRAHIIRATLEAICFQTRAILDAMKADSGTALKTVKVDGGLTNSNNLLNILTNLTGIPVERPSMRETTALGSAIAAGLAVGVWKDLAEVDKVVGGGVGVETFDPKMKNDVREAEYAIWKRAVEKSFGWSDVTDSHNK